METKFLEFHQRNFSLQLFYPVQIPHSRAFFGSEQPKHFLIIVLDVLHHRLVGNNLPLISDYFLMDSKYRINFWTISSWIDRAVKDTYLEKEWAHQDLNLGPRLPKPRV